MAATEDLPIMLTQAVSVEVERIGNKGSSSQIPRIMRILEHYAAYANNMAKVLIAIKNMCMREDGWVVRLYLQRELPRVIAAALRAHSSNGNFVARACEVVSAVSHVVRTDAVAAFTAQGTVEALVGCLAILQEDAPPAARVLQTIGFMAAHGNEVSSCRRPCQETSGGRVPLPRRRVFPLAPATVVRHKIAVRSGCPSLADRRRLFPELRRQCRPPRNL
jgi:hypothetical protein